MKLLHIIGAALLICSSLSAQNGKLIGVVLDADSGDPLAGANIYLEAVNQGTTSEEDGTFLLENLPAGDYRLTVGFLGYREFKSRIHIPAGQTARVEVRLIPTPLLGKEITVVATRAVAGKTPAAFSTLKREEIEQRYFAQDIPAMLSELPSTTSYSESGNAIGYNYLSIRGFDQRRISVMINGVPQNDPEDHNVYWVNFPDLLGNVEDVQVQRGAGSAFYGPPAIGGSVNIITARFSPERRIAAYSGFGSFNTRKLSLAYNSGLIKDRYVIFSRFSQIKSDGYRDRSWVDFKSYFVGAARFGKRSSLRLHFYGGPIKDHLAYYGVSKAQANDPRQRTINPITRPDEVENFNQPHLELIHRYQVNDQLTISNTLLGIRGYGFFDFSGGGWAAYQYLRLTPEFGFDISPDSVWKAPNDLLIRAYVDNKQAGWLTNLTWESPQWRVIVGGEFRIHRSLHWGRIQKANPDELPQALPESGFSGRNYIGDRRFYQYKGGKDLLAPYLHTTYQINPRLSARFDLQYTFKRYRLYDEQFVGNDFSTDYNFLNPRLGFNYHLTPRANVFISFSRTSREPRLKNLYDAAESSWGVLPEFERQPDDRFDFSKPLTRPEKLNDIELGLSYSGDEQRGSINLYYMDFRDEIIKKGGLDVFGQPITGNAQRTLHAGVELSAATRLAGGLQFSGNLTYSKNELTKYTSYETDSEGNPVAVVLDGNSVAGFPDFLANARLSYQKSGLNASLLMQHVGKQYTDNFQNDDNSVDPYTVFHGMVGYDLQSLISGVKVHLQLHIRNLFDKLYIAHGEGATFFPAADRHVFLNARVEL